MATSAKKRTKQDRSIDHELSTNSDAAQEVVENFSEDPPQKKKKKKKHHTEREEGDGDNRLDYNPSSETVNVDSTPQKKKKKKSKEKIEETYEPLSAVESGVKKEKKKSKHSKGEDDHEIQTAGESTDLAAIEKKKKKKQKGQDTIEESASGDAETEGDKSEELKLNVNNISSTEPVSQPALSALTRERMEKWKKRNQSKNISFAQDSDVNPPVEPEKKENKNVKSDPSKKKPSPVTLYNPNITVQNYNHKRVLAALGYDVKKYENKRVKIEMPPTKFRGSNLDSILGYGEGLQS